MTVEANLWNKNNSSWRETKDSSSIAINVSVNNEVSFSVIAVPNDTVTNAGLANMPAWTVKIRNAGTTGDPSDAALADFTTATATASAYAIGFLDSGELRKFAVSSLSPGVNRQSFDASGTWTKPPSGTVAFVQAWGAGGSGGRAGANDAGGGGGGGSYVEQLLVLASLSASVSVTIGAGGVSRTADNTDGAVGANTTFGAYVTAYGGGGGSGNGATNGGGGGGGQTGIGASSAASGNGANGGNIRPVFGFVDSFALEITVTWGTGSIAATRQGGGNVSGGGGGGFGGSGAAGTAGGQSTYGGGGGGGGSEATGAAATGGASIYGGGGGGGGSSTTAAAVGGSSLWGGAGGAGNFDANNAVAGTQPGGGGGGSEIGNSGAGGDGRVIITVW